MLELYFYDNVDDNLLKYAVIISKTDGKWVFCKHKKRTTYEIPAGHREKNEAIFDTAKRELIEETGAINFSIKPICPFNVRFNNKDSYGMLYFAEINSFGKIDSEIENIIITEKLIDNWTYPDIQPKLIDEAIKRGFI
ncbi:NUDIX hydrolase [Oceanivirga salmonicida]|uniref:NUDIX hydrolase n=1 Tax=Oceanivirga salmonicida TaxID=1769291 RepID=UPI00082F99F8|nr:NUDIX domain-containing protein [Oceanivirga salmonicida]